ncbi:glycoside hydrolase family 78 protein [Paenibacillus sp. MZ04-78.2]|uniref:alpha-L-rhamnosidase n=1 Tax=Paenibacillus sp. MZ04-78.2 TaxID=2962034 RepID=UPI0020B770B1|nr:alpha-L-rhamnosidase [Paenibacillus sp. MZ04-78.2]MCP3775765.1 glycoside hydrolase family 78 protein [Paenibacillus sp. MZ04-78.2]
MGASATSLRIEYLENPLGIDELKPRFSWAIHAAGRGARQTAYRIIVSSDAANLDEDMGDMWDTGKVVSGQSANVAYMGSELQSGTPYYWKVQIWDHNDEASAWSSGHWSMGLLRRDEWKGKWIGLNSDVVPTMDRQKPSVYLRKTFAADKPVKRATLYVTALGLYVCHLNGVKAGDYVLAPEWTDYKTRVYYQTFDVTGQIMQGDNAIGLTLGQGWYAGFVGLFDFQKYGKDPYALLQLNIEYEDGSSGFIATDTSWKASFGPIVSSDLIMGEIYDSRLEMPGWNEAGFDASGWSAPDVFFEYKGYLNGQCSPAIKTIMEMAPKKIMKLAAGRFLIDMGQNMVGRIRLTMPAGAEAGHQTTIRFGEVLTPAGELYTENLRNARQTDVYIAKGPEVQTYTSSFTFHGFRFIEIDGYPGELAATALVAEVIQSAMDDSGSVETSDEMVNRLFSNIRWTQRGNFISVPTDCPQRDERCGWTGDAQIYSFTASYNMDVAAFFKKWMIDVEDAQWKNGAFTDIAPHLPYSTISKYFLVGSSGWADAGVIIPWNMYRIYGDIRILERHYDAMSRWIAYNEMLHPQHVRDITPQYGDWLSIPTEELEGAQFGTRYSAYSTTPYDVFGTAYYAHVTQIMRDVAGVLDKAEDERKFGALYERIKAAFNKEFVREDGQIKGRTQTSYAMALYFGLLPEDKREFAARHLVAGIESQNWHITTGIHGIRYLLPVLSEYGYDDVAYRLLMQDTFPSWMYTIKQGATTIWERWDGWTEETGFQNTLMNSFNHYALGAVGEWMYRYMGGIDPEEPGYTKMVIRPRIEDRLRKADVQYRCIHGLIRSNWSLTDSGGLELTVTVPANTTAKVYVPLKYGTTILEGGKPAGQAEGAVCLSGDADNAVFECQPGTYRFTTER